MALLHQVLFPQRLRSRFARVGPVAIAAVTCLAGCVIVNGCAQTNDSVRVIAPGFNTGVAISFSARGGSIGSMMICSDGAEGKVTIQAVRLVGNNGDMRLVTFASRPNPFLTKKRKTGGLLDAAQPLARLGFDPGGPQDVLPCISERKFGTVGTSESAVQLERLGTRSGIITGVDVVYEDQRGRMGSLLIPYAIALCATKNSSCSKARTPTNSAS